MMMMQGGRRVLSRWTQKSALQKLYQGSSRKKTFQTSTINPCVSIALGNGAHMVLNSGQIRFQSGTTGSRNETPENATKDGHDEQQVAPSPSQSDSVDEDTSDRTAEPKAETAAVLAEQTTEESERKDRKENQDDDDDDGEDEDGPNSFWENVFLFLKAIVGMGTYALAVGGTAAMFTHQCLAKWNAYHSCLRLLWDGERIFDELDLFCEEVNETSQVCLEFLGDSPQVWHANLATLRQEQAQRLKERKLVDQENLLAIEKSNTVWWMPGWLGLFRSTSDPESKEFRFEWWRLRQQVRSLHETKVQQMTQELRALHHEGLVRLREVRDEVPKWALLMGWGEEDLYRGMQQVTYSLTRLRVVEAETKALMHQMGEGGFEDMWRVYHEASERVVARRRKRLAHLANSTENEQEEKQM